MKPANRLTTIVVHVAVRLNLPARHAIGVADVNAVLTEAVEPWSLPVRRFLALHGLVMCAQGECARGGVHRVREGSVELGPAGLTTFDRENPGDEDLGVPLNLWSK